MKTKQGAIWLNLEALAIIILLCIPAGCGSGGSSSSERKDKIALIELPNPDEPEELPVDGQVARTKSLAGTKIRVMDINNDLVKEATTSTTGHFSLNIPVDTKFPVTFTTLSVPPIKALMFKPATTANATQHINVITNLIADEYLEINTSSRNAASPAFSEKAEEVMSRLLDSSISYEVFSNDPNLSAFLSGKTSNFSGILLETLGDHAARNVQDIDAMLLDRYDNFKNGTLPFLKDNTYQVALSANLVGVEFSSDQIQSATTSLEAEVKAKLSSATSAMAQIRSAGIDQNFDSAEVELLLDSVTLAVNQALITEIKTPSEIALATDRLTNLLNNSRSMLETGMIKVIQESAPSLTDPVVKFAVMGNASRQAGYVLDQLNITQPLSDVALTAGEVFVRETVIDTANILTENIENISSYSELTTLFQNLQTDVQQNTVSITAELINTGTLHAYLNPVIPQVAQVAEVTPDFSIGDDDPTTPIDEQDPVDAPSPSTETPPDTPEVPNPDGPPPVLFPPTPGT